MGAWPAPAAITLPIMASWMALAGIPKYCRRSGQVSQAVGTSSPPPPPPSPLKPARSMAPLAAMVPSSVTESEASLLRKLPIGVRAVDTM